jgi:hypothetical protein
MLGIIPPDDFEFEIALCLDCGWLELYKGAG